MLSVSNIIQPNIFKTVTVTAAGFTNIWIPAAGKKFRLMRYSISITGNSVQAVAGNFEMVLNDYAMPIGCAYSANVPAAAANAFGSTSSGEIQLGNGYLSSGINQPLQIQLSAALTAGECRVNVWGTEE